MTQATLTDRTFIDRKARFTRRVAIVAARYTDSARRQYAIVQWGRGVAEVTEYGDVARLAIALRLLRKVVR